MRAIIKIKVHIFVLIFLVIITTMIKCQPLYKQLNISLGSLNNSFLNFTEATAKNQYSSEEHTVITEDGYVLTIFRIIKAKNCHHKKKHRPVLLIHGLLQNSDVFLDAGTSAGLAYLLSDACYDVWVGNKRGNNYGRKHIKWNPDNDTEFWQFSIDEHGIYDIPATIDYMLKATRADKINYIGYSQGGGAYFIMCSEKPDYCEKTAVMIGLAPGVLFNHCESLPAKAFALLTLYLKDVLTKFRVQELYKKGNVYQILLENLCQTNGWTWVEMFCTSFLFLDNYHPRSMSLDTQRLMFSNILVGTSMNTIAQYAQILKSGKFKKFDFGETINLQRYNSAKPPEYNLNIVSTPVVLIQGKNDKIIHIQDTLTLKTKLPKVLEMVVVSDPKWTHIDMVYSKHIKNMIYPTIKKYLEMFSENNM